jgi:hypothetical protein
VELYEIVSFFGYPLPLLYLEQLLLILVEKEKHLQNMKEIPHRNIHIDLLENLWIIFSEVTRESFFKI